MHGRNIKTCHIDINCQSTNTVVRRYNDHLYNGNLDFRRNSFGNWSFLIKIYYNGIHSIRHQQWFSATNCIFVHNFHSLKRQKNQRSNCPHGSFIIYQPFQRAVCKGQWRSLSLPGWKNPPKKLEFLQFLPRFQVLSLLSLFEKFDNNIQKYCPTACFSRFIEFTVIRDKSRANQDKIAAHLFCVYSSCDRNNMKSLQRQIHFNVINHWWPTPTL